MSVLPAECRTCAVGLASGEGQGLFCPLIVRDYRRGHVLHRRDQAADYIWYVKHGRVDVEERGTTRNLGPGNFIGVEALVCDRYRTTSRCATNVTLCGATREGMAQWLGPQSQRACVIMSSLLERTTEPLEPNQTRRTSHAPEDHLPGDCSPGRDRV